MYAASPSLHVNQLRSAVAGGFGHASASGPVPTISSQGVSAVAAGAAGGGPGSVVVSSRFTSTSTSPHVSSGQHGTRAWEGGDAGGLGQPGAQAQEESHASMMLDFGRALELVAREVRLPHNGEPCRVRIGVHRCASGAGGHKI